MERFNALPKPQQNSVISVLALQSRWRGRAMTAIESNLLAKLKRQPPARVSEAVDFVDFLAGHAVRIVIDANTIVSGVISAACGHRRDLDDDDGGSQTRFA